MTTEILNIHDFYDRYTEWVQRTFGIESSTHGAVKLQKEAKELEENPSSIVEHADCLMCVLYSFKCNFPEAGVDDLLKSAYEKLEINEKREWIKQPDGTYQHKK